MDTNTQLAAPEREHLSRAAFSELVKVVHLVSQAGAQELRGHGLTPAQYQLLVAVGRSPGIVQRGLTERLGVTKGNVSQLVTRLEEAGLLDRSRDGAANQLVLTSAGKALVSELVPAHDSFLARQFAALDDDDLRRLGDILAALGRST